MSRDFLVAWEPTWPEDATTGAAFRRRLDRQLAEWRDGTGYAFFIFDRGTDELLGGITLANLRRGVAQSGSLGYWMGKPYAGRGYMRSEEHTSELQSLMRISYAVFCLKKKQRTT